MLQVGAATLFSVLHVQTRFIQSATVRVYVFRGYNAAQTGGGEMARELATQTMACL